MAWVIRTGQIRIFHGFVSIGKDSEHGIDKESAGTIRLHAD
jgi:hypothetical protein